MNFWKRLFSNPAVPEARTQSESLLESRYSSKEYGFGFTVPAGTKIYTTFTDGASKHGVSAATPIVIINPSFPEENIKIKADDGVSESDLGEFKANIERNPHMPFPKYKRVSIQHCKIGAQNDKPAVEHVFFAKGKVYGKLRQITFQHEGRGFTATCGTSEERFETANQHFFNTVLSSLEFTPLLTVRPGRKIPLNEWPVMSFDEALRGLLQALRLEQGTKYRVGPHPNQQLKGSLCFLGGDLVESSATLSAALVQLGGTTTDSKAVMAELEKLTSGVLRHVPITEVGEICNDIDHLVLQASSGASVVVSRPCFEYLWSAHPSCKVLLLLPTRTTVAFVGNDGNDGLLLVQKG
jgi:hypothetical protein